METKRLGCFFVDLSETQRSVGCFCFFFRWKTEGFFFVADLVCFLFVGFRVFFGVEGVEGLWGEMFETRAGRGFRWLRKFQKNVIGKVQKKCDDFWDRGMTEMMEMHMMWRWFSFHVDG